ncbi:kinase-like domain-containing protein [Mycena rebaudengoi]|nr:kinase-like domain-containing protein [Mycena rebaudengoi]
MTMLNDSEVYKTFLSCRGTQAQHMLDLVQDLLDCDFPASRPSLFKALIRLSRASGLHPRCFPLTGLEKVGEQVAAGGFGDIWKGLVQGQHVSVKVMRIFQQDDIEVVVKEFGREALIWRQLSHPNLLPFFGLYYWDKRLCLISPWMENGNVLEFLRRTSASEAKRISLMWDISFGLEYLHQNHIVHGDLKAINVLVTPSLKACITDFGLSSIADVVTLRFTHSTVSAKGGTTRWQAPELLSGDPNHYGSDIYAFGCVCYEVPFSPPLVSVLITHLHQVLTGKAPFYEIQRDVAIIMKVIAGERPSRPPGSGADPLLMNSLWTLLQDCWVDNAGDRPVAAQIVKRLLGPPINARISKPSADWDKSYTSKFRRSLRSMPFLPCVHDIEHRICGHDTAKACTECPLDRNLATQNAGTLASYHIYCVPPYSGAANGLQMVRKD